MTTGSLNQSAPLTNATASGGGWTRTSLTWTGLLAWKVWNGGDKFGPVKSYVSSPRAPTKHRGAFEKRRKTSSEAPFHPDTKIGRREAKRVPDPSLAAAPYQGRETVRWSEVNRLENARPSRADAEFHDYDVEIVNVRQSAGQFVIPDYYNVGTQSWVVITGSATPEEWCGLPVFTHTWSSSDDYVMLEKLRERIAGSDFNAGVFLGESREALRMIAESATRLYRAYRAARKGNFYDAARALGVSPRVKKGTVAKRVHLASRWLELQYGWLPLLKDVYGGAEFLAHHLNVPLQKRYRVRRKAIGQADTASPVNYFYQDAWCVTQGQIIAIVKEKDVPQLSGLLDPASIAWELLPFSFVADWFIPIGSWLSSRGLEQALEGTFITTKTRRDHAANLVARPQPYPYKVPGEYGYRKVVVERRVTDHVTVPLPSWKPLNKVFSWKRAANAVALLTVLGSGQPLPFGARTD